MRRMSINGDTRPCQECGQPAIFNKRTGAHNPGKDAHGRPRVVDHGPGWSCTSSTCGVRDQRRVWFKASGDGHVIVKKDTNDYVGDIWRDPNGHWTNHCASENELEMVKRGPFETLDAAKAEFRLALYK